MVDIPLREGSCVNLNDAVLDKRIGPDQLVVGCVIDDVQDSGFASDCLRGPVEVTLLEPKGSELEVTSSDSNSSDPGSIRDEFGVGDWSCLLEGSILFVDWHPATGQSPLVS